MGSPDISSTKIRWNVFFCDSESFQFRGRVLVWYTFIILVLSLGKNVLRLRTRVLVRYVTINYMSEWTHPYEHHVLISNLLFGSCSDHCSLGVRNPRDGPSKLTMCLNLGRVPGSPVSPCEYSRHPVVSRGIRG